MIITSLIRLFSLTFFVYKVSKAVNIGTVLFVDEDLERACWSPSSTRLLWTRLIVEDLLPNPTVLSIVDDEIVNYLLDYIKMVYTTIHKELGGNRKYAMLLAFSDALGGYLRHIVMPNVKYSFYAGTLDFSSVEKIQELYKETKAFLKTNGQGWAQPIGDSSCKCEPHSFSISCPKDCKACEALTLYYGPNRFENCDKSPPCALPDVAVPLPYFDRLIKPTVLAVPLKSYPLRGLRAPWGLNLVAKYYLTGYKCLIKRRSPTAMKLFQNGVYSWLVEEVMPLLGDEDVYTVFGGVLRVMATLKRLGAKRINLHALRKRYTHMTDEYVRRNSMWTLNKHKRIAVTVMAFLLFWFLFGFCFICFKYKPGFHKDDRGRDGTRRSGTDYSCNCEGMRGIFKSWIFKTQKSPRRGSSRSGSPGGIRKDCMCFAVKEIHNNNLEETEVEDEESFLEDEIPQIRRKMNDDVDSQRRTICVPSYTFGYDFQTSTSESPSDTDSELDTQSHTPETRSR